MNRGSLKAVLAISLFTAALAALGTRQYRNLLDPADPQAGNWGLADFRDVIYYPTVALLEGSNPYDAHRYMSEYPVGNVFPLYTPHLLLFFLPFGLLPFGLSGVLFWLLLVATYPLFAALCLRACEIRPLLHRVFLLATLILISIPGRWAFDAGQLAVLWSMGAMFALQYASTRPTLAGLGLVLALCKPTFGVPLALLLLFQRRFKPVLIGAGIVVGVSVLVLAVIAAGAGWDSIWTMLDQNQSVLEAARPFDPARSHTRTDANVFLLQVLDMPGGRGSEAAVFAVVLLLAGAALWGSTTCVPASAAGALALLATVVGTYHQTYDAVLLAPIPLALLAPSRRLWKSLPYAVSFAVGVLSAVPFFNVFWTTTFSSLLQRCMFVTEGALERLAGITAVVNSTACLLAFSLLVVALLTKGRKAVETGRLTSDDVEH